MRSSASPTRWSRPLNFWNEGDGRRLADRLAKTSEGAGCSEIHEFSTKRPNCRFHHSHSNRQASTGSLGECRVMSTLRSEVRGDGTGTERAGAISQIPRQPRRRSGVITRMVLRTALEHQGRICKYPERPGSGGQQPEGS